MLQVFKIESYWAYFCLLANNNFGISRNILRNIMRIIEATSEEIIKKWYDFYGEIEYYC